MTWETARAKLKKEYEAKGITTCELQMGNCWHNNALSFAHRHKRIYYKSRPELLGDFNQTILACVPCHQKLEKSRVLTARIFDDLRDPE